MVGHSLETKTELPYVTPKSDLDSRLFTRLDIPHTIIMTDLNTDLCVSTILIFSGYIPLKGSSTHHGHLIRRE